MTAVPLKIALIVPPMSNINAMYSAVPRLTGWLRKLGHEVEQVDLSLELFLAIFSRAGLSRLFAAIDPRRVVGELEDVYQNRDRYIRVIDEIVARLRGRNLAGAGVPLRPDFVPEGPAFRKEPPGQRQRRFARSGPGDLSRHLCTLAIADLAELFRHTISPHFALLNYGDSLVRSDVGFDAIADSLARPRNEIETLILETAAALIAPDVDVAGFTCPFPGMLISSLLIGGWLGEHRPHVRRVLGGGYPSTALRHLADPRVFDFIDDLVLDDGEVPLQQICARIEAPGLAAPLVRTFTRDDGKVVWHGDAQAAAPRFRDLPAPDYRGVAVHRYVNLVYHAGSIPRLLNEGFWLKLTAAHGCYWKKCTFCDIHLSYIGDFDPIPARDLADQMDALHDETGVSSFHFTDEAAPPPLLVNLALELLRRGRSYQFWGNIRYDVGFTPDRCRLLAAAGLIAVSGGIEIASDALLPAIAKGITVPQVIKVLQAFSGAGVTTHAYLIYGFPGETPEDTVNSLEVVRQLMAARLLSSGYYHQFSLTAHSPIGKNPELFGLRVIGPRPAGFADYELDYRPLEGRLPDPRVLAALNGTLDAYAGGELLDRDVRGLFAGLLPAPAVPPDLVRRHMATPHPELQIESRVCWLGGTPRWHRGLLTVSCADGELYTAQAPRLLADDLAQCHPSGWTRPTPPLLSSFDRAWIDDRLRARGVVLV